MTQDEEKRVHRHPDAVAYLEGLDEEGASVVRPYEGGHVRYWIEGGEVRSLEVAEDGPLPALLAAVSAEFGPQLPRLASDLASGVPDLDGVERALRDAALGGGATALKQLVERLDRALPAPRCESCGTPMRRCQERKGKSFLTRLGRVEFRADVLPLPVVRQGLLSAGPGAGPGGEHLHAGDGERHGRDGAADEFRCGEPAHREPCRGGRFVELPAALVAGVRRGGAPVRAGGGGRWQASGIAHVSLDRRDRHSDAERGRRRRCGEAGRREFQDARGEARGHVHRRGAGSGDRRGAEGPGQRDVQLPDRQRGGAVRRQGSLGVRRAAGPRGRRRGLHDAGELVVISDGAEWTRNTCQEIFGGRKVTFVLDMFHALEYASGAVKAILPDREGRNRRFEEIKADIAAGRGGRGGPGTRALQRRHEDVAACCRYFRNNMERMRYNEYRDLGMQVGSGVVESGCRQYGLRLKRPGTRWSERGANAMLALKSCVMNLRLPEFLDWQARQAVAASH